mmetsp:Transcript_79216/g.220231  ORF Transcript_79216/g.220231 Transcript_79216/m.220231 type:complete len:229 (+) Transcript_79216:855-1541(+)
MLKPERVSESKHVLTNDQIAGSALLKFPHRATRNRITITHIVPDAKHRHVGKRVRADDIGLKGRPAVCYAIFLLAEKGDEWFVHVANHVVVCDHVLRVPHEAATIDRARGSGIAQQGLRRAFPDRHHARRGGFEKFGHPLLLVVHGAGGERRGATREPAAKEKCLPLREKRPPQRRIHGCRTTRRRAGRRLRRCPLGGFGCDSSAPVPNRRLWRLHLRAVFRHAQKAP